MIHYLEYPLLHCLFIHSTTYVPVSLATTLIVVLMDLAHLQASLGQQLLLGPGWIELCIAQRCTKPKV